MTEVVKYEAEGFSDIDVVIEDETVWLTQAQMVELFESSKGNISEHIKNIYASEELEEISTVRNFRTVRLEGSREVARSLDYYNLDVIIAVGYRVNTKHGTQFRRWATSVLREHLLKGYTVKQPVSVEQLNELQSKISEALQRQDKMDIFVYEEFGKIYEIINQFFEQKKLQESKRRPIGFQV